MQRDEFPANNVLGNSALELLSGIKVSGPSGVFVDLGSFENNTLETCVRNKWSRN